MTWLDGLERWFERAYRIRPIGEGGYIFRLGLVRHRGARIVLRDGTVVEPGDLVGELHMDNRRAASLHTEGKGGLRFRREVFRLLPALADDLQTRPEYREVHAICGASLFWAEAERAGFEHRPFPALTRWWLGWWERFLLAHYHPEGRRRLMEGHRTELRQVWITRRTLIERYGRHLGSRQAQPSRGASPAPGSPP